MKEIKYQVVVGDKGFAEFEEKISKMLNNGWKTIGGVAFNAGFAHQAMAKAIENNDKNQGDKKITPGAISKNLTANESLKKLDELT